MRLAQGTGMHDPLDVANPDGPIDPEDIPTPLAGSPWLDDEDDDSTTRSPSFLVRIDPE